MGSFSIAMFARVAPGIARLAPVLRARTIQTRIPTLTTPSFDLNTRQLTSNAPMVASSDFDKDAIVESYDYPLEPLGDPSRRAFTYVVLGGARFIYASAARLAAIKFIATMSASADVLALASTEVDLGNLEEGSSMTVKWRGKPVFIRHRNEAEISSATSVAMSDLRDQETDESRVKDPAWLIVIGVCTHLGCVPLAGAGDFGGYFCPCHGSHYDTSGRIRKGPAPLNLEVPEYDLDLDAGKLIIG